MSIPRLTLAIVAFGLAIAALIIPVKSPDLLAAYAGFLSRDWLPLIANAGMLIGFMLVATGLAPKKDVSTAALAGFVLYLGLGGFMRLPATASAGNLATLTPAGVLEQALTWPSFLAGFFIPLL